MAAEIPEICAYAREGSLAGVLEELAKGADVNARNSNEDRTPLMEAVASQNVEVDLVRLLVQRGADVNAFSSNIVSVLSLGKIDEIAAVLLHKAEEIGSAANIEAMKAMAESMREIMPSKGGDVVMKETVLSLAVRNAGLDTIKILLDAGADIQYTRPHGYDVLIDATCGGMASPDSRLLPILQLLIDRGAKLNSVSDYSESALSVASNCGRFEVVRFLLAAGADAAPLQWTPLMQAIALGTARDVEAQLQNKPDISAKDFWDRTPWLLSLQVGEIDKARQLLDAGANRLDRGRCGKPPLIYPIVNGHKQMLQWLLSEGFDPNETDDFQSTALMEAAEMGNAEFVGMLIDAGADIHRLKNSQAAIRMASSLETVRQLVAHGADLNEISDEMRAKLTKRSLDGKPEVSENDYRKGRRRRFGQSNPEIMNIPFWKAMVASGAQAYAARQQFNDTAIENDPVWCFRRFGKSINVLPDGRIIEIAGEHEDHYDPDFCIYNEVFVHHADGALEIYGYPKAVFPPTDFHSATQIGNGIYIIGNLGYGGERNHGNTPVYRLDLQTFQIQKVTTSGEMPGWIYGHKAIGVQGARISIFGGKVCDFENNMERHTDNHSEFRLDLCDMIWRKLG